MTVPPTNVESGCGHLLTERSISNCWSVHSPHTLRIRPCAKAKKACAGLGPTRSIEAVRSPGRGVLDAHPLLSPSGHATLVAHATANGDLFVDLSGPFCAGVNTSKAIHMRPMSSPTSIPQAATMIAIQSPPAATSTSATALDVKDMCASSSNRFLRLQVEGHGGREDDRERMTGPDRRNHGDAFVLVPQHSCLDPRPKQREGKETRRPQARSVR